jgi:hypothetical protein
MHPRITIIALLSLLSFSLALPITSGDGKRPATPLKEFYMLTYLPLPAIEARFDDSIPSMAPTGDDPVEFKNPA